MASSGSEEPAGRSWRGGSLVPEDRLLAAEEVFQRAQRLRVADGPLGPPPSTPEQGGCGVQEGACSVARRRGAAP
jgi:hypothetical protein